MDLCYPPRIGFAAQIACRIVAIEGLQDRGASIGLENAFFTLLDVAVEAVIGVHGRVSKTVCRALQFTVGLVSIHHHLGCTLLTQIVEPFRDNRPIQTVVGKPRMVGEGVPTLSETAALVEDVGPDVAYRVPDLTDATVAARYAGRHVVVAGSGHSALTALVASGRPVVAEMYPAYLLRTLGVTVARKSDPAARAACGRALLRRVGTDVRLDLDAVRRLLRGGFGPSRSGEDPFDATIACIALAKLLLDGAMPEAPDHARAVEGWILGLPSEGASTARPASD